ncbi:MAG TPA: YlbF family regulator, partial [Anaerolineae bacterium]|nr:YlbF family regulator [Anaerolineae bacterium]
MTNQSPAYSINNSALNELELASPEVVRQSARGFAVALGETPQYQTFDAAVQRLYADEVAMVALEAYQTLQRSLQTMFILNAVSDHDRAELERLRRAYAARPAVKAFAQAQAELISLC